MLVRTRVHVVSPGNAIVMSPYTTYACPSKETSVTLHGHLGRLFLSSVDEKSLLTITDC